MILSMVKKIKIRLRLCFTFCIKQCRASFSCVLNRSDRFSRLVSAEIYYSRLSSV